MRKQPKKLMQAAVSGLISLLSVFYLVISAHAVYLDMEVIPQDPDPAVGELCCWACCGTSVCRYYGRNMTVHNFVYSVKGVYSRKIGGTKTISQMDYHNRESEV